MYKSSLAIEMCVYTRVWSNNAQGMPTTKTTTTTTTTILNNLVVCERETNLRNPVEHKKSNQIYWKLNR